jgi:O-acetyl-ADP-ribose deacetylase (regulator of RNase III)
MTPSAITYIVGDATRPVGSEMKIIAHCCNDKGVWGAGFVAALSKRWKEPEQAYRTGYDILNPGGVQFVQVAEAIIVANIIGQHGTGWRNGEPPIRYDWLRKGLEAVANTACALDAGVHLPRIGCGLAGGTWDKVEPLIIRELCAKDVPVFVYDLPSKQTSNPK